jgi:hypothetical protein
MMRWKSILVYLFAALRDDDVFEVVAADENTITAFIRHTTRRTRHTAQRSVERKKRERKK